MARKSGYEKDVEAGMPKALCDLRETERKGKKKLTTEAEFAARETGAAPEPKPKKTKAAKKAEPKKGTRSAPATPEEKKRVLKLHNEGLSFRKIEAAMGWHDCSGARAHRIVVLAG